MGRRLQNGDRVDVHYAAPDGSTLIFSGTFLGMDDEWVNLVDAGHSYSYIPRDKIVRIIKPKFQHKNED